MMAKFSIPNPCARPIRLEEKAQQFLTRLSRTYRLWPLAVEELATKYGEGPNTTAYTIALLGTLLETDMGKCSA